MSSKVTSFFGESLSEVVFARKTELEENIDNWYAYLFNVVEKERKELFYKMLENEGKIYPKDLVGFRSKFSDALGWLWINVFLAGDKSLTDNVSFSNTEGEDVVEFAEKGLSFNIESLVAENDKYKQLLDTLKENGKTTIEYDGFNYTKRELLEAIRDNNEDIIRLQKLDIGSKKTTKKQYDELEGVKRKAGITSKPSKTRSKDKTITDDELTTKAKEKNINVDDVKRLKEITQGQRTRRGSSESDATGFINDTDFGRVYVQQRRDYIANVYTNKTEKENMLGVFDQMNKQYEEGNASPPIQKYFERRYMRKKDGVTTIGNVDLETEPPVNIGGVTLVGKRKSPNPQRKNDPLRELKLYEDVRKNMGGKISDGRLRNIVKTEVVAAYNMGRLHQMYTDRTKFVRWVNDVENRTEGKVCQICTIRAMGTSESLRKFAGKESLSGIYTIEDAFTNRQLAIPSHVNCLCSYRPINPEEEKVLVAAGVFQTNLANTASVVAGIAGATVEGVNNSQIAKEGTDRSGWWYGALAVGGTAVAIGSMMWYLRKSLTSKYAAKLMKTKGVETLEKVSERGLIPIEIPNRKTLMSSLKLTDDIKLDPTEIKPQKYSKQELKALPELGSELPDFETLIRVESSIGDDLLEVGVNHTTTINLKNQYKDKGLPNTLLETTLNDNITTVNQHITTLDEIFKQSTGEKRNAYARLLTEEQRNLKTLNEMVSGINKREVGVPNYRMDMRELNDLFQELDEVPYTVGDKTILLGDEPVKTQVKQGVINIKERFGTNGIVDTENNYMQEKLASLSQKKTITRKEYEEVMSFLRKSQRDKSFAEVALTNDDANYMSQLRYVYNDSPGSLREELREVVKKDLAHTELITQMLNTTKTLRESTPTYASKLREGSKTDKFITPKDLTRNDANIRISAIESRRKIIPTIDAILNYMEETRIPNLDNYYVLNDFSNILEVGGIKLEDFQTKNKREKMKFLQGVRSKLIDDARKIERVEFSRFQQKWAMFGSPR